MIGWLKKQRIARQEHRVQWGDILLFQYRRISSFNSLEQNWDSYGAEAISPATRLRAYATLTYLNLDCLRTLFIAPMSGDGIMFEWYDTNGVFILELSAGHSQKWFVREGDRTEEGSFVGALPIRVQRRIEGFVERHVGMRTKPLTYYTMPANGTLELLTAPC